MKISLLFTNSLTTVAFGLYDKLNANTFCVADGVIISLKLYTITVPLSSTLIAL